MTFEKHIKIGFLTAVLMLSCSCDQSPFKTSGSNLNNKRELPPPKEAPPEDDLPIEGDVCYLGPTENYGTCLNLVNLNDIPEQDEYQYRDPINDPQFPNSFNQHQYIGPLRLVDLKSHEPSQLLSENFKLSEFMLLRKGAYALLSPFVLRALQSMRWQLGSPIRINSAFRGPLYNKGIGGATWSRHQYGDAVDIASSSASLVRLQDLCKHTGADFTLLYKTHVHCDWRDQALDESFFPPPVQELPFLPAAMAYHQLSEITHSIKDNLVFLDVTHPESEDGEGLVYLWKIEWSNGEKSTSDQRKFTSTVLSDKALVTVHIGNSIIVTRRIQF